MVDGKAHIDENLCSGCGACVAACPQNAIIEERALVPQQQEVAPKPKPAPAESGLKKTIIALGSSLVSFAVSRFLANLDSDRPGKQNQPMRQGSRGNGKGQGTGRGNGGKRRRRRGRKR